VRLERLQTPIGEAIVVTTEDGALAGLDWADRPERLTQLLERYHGPVTLDEVADAPTAAARAVERFFAGEVGAIEDLPVDTGGTAFQQEVWAALRGIEAGTTTTYSALAQMLGRPDAVRAVGAANGANPVSIVLPCHRVVGAGGELRGYAGGLARKRWLLRHEGAPVPPEQGALF